MLRTLRKRLAFGEEVIEALYGKNKKPIVALESTIISHGMPFPQNLEMAKTVEDLVRAQGACPATICIADGELKVGLSDHDLYALAEMGSSARKCSTRDIPAAVSEKIIGATTVSSTMRIAHAAGIRVFVTGGIGGVHRFSEETMDISTDLFELSRTPVAVVCAGIKSILDIPRTLEFLETHSVPVIGYQSDQFPAFFTQDSGMKAHLRRDTPRGCADVIHESLGLELPNGFVVAVPNPNPVAEDVIQLAIEQGLKEVLEQGIKGQAVTPYLLKRLNEITNGVSLGSNIDLVMNNAKVGSQIARSLFDMENGMGMQSDIHFSIMEPKHAPVHSVAIQPPVSSVNTGMEVVKRSNVGNVLVVGGLVLDIISASTEQIIRETSNIGTIRQSSGGVGRNIAECLQRLDVNPLLVSAIGDDPSGSILLANMKQLDMSTDGIHISSETPTAVYSAVIGSTGNLDVAIADMRALDLIDTTTITVETIKGSKLVVADGNLSPHALGNLLTRSTAAGIPVWFEPTSVQKSLRVIEAGVVSHLTYVSPNIDELAAMSTAIQMEEQGSRSHERFKLSDDANILPQKLMTQLKNDCISLLSAMVRPSNGAEKHVIVTLGKHGVLVASANVNPIRVQASVAQLTQYGAKLWGSHSVHNKQHDGKLEVSMVHLPGVQVTDIIDCTGAGDSLVGGTVYGLLKGKNIYKSCHLGMIAARQSLISRSAIHPELTQEMLKQE